MINLLIRGKPSRSDLARKPLHKSPMKGLIPKDVQKEWHNVAYPRKHSVALSLCTRICKI